jgi:hypothetical protein
MSSEAIYGQGIITRNKGKEKRKESNAREEKDKQEGRKIQ